MRPTAEYGGGVGRGDGTHIPCQSRTCPNRSFLHGHCLAGRALVHSFRIPRHVPNGHASDRTPLAPCHDIDAERAVPFPTAFVLGPPRALTMAPCGSTSGRSSCLSNNCRAGSWTQTNAMLVYPRERRTPRQRPRASTDPRSRNPKYGAHILWVRSIGTIRSVGAHEVRPLAPRGLHKSLNWPGASGSLWYHWRDPKAAQPAGCEGSCSARSRRKWPLEHELHTAHTRTCREQGLLGLNLERGRAPRRQPLAVQVVWRRSYQALRTT